MAMAVHAEQLPASAAVRLIIAIAGSIYPWTRFPLWGLDRFEPQNGMAAMLGLNASRGGLPIAAGPF